MRLISTLAGITNLGNLANAHAAVTNVNNNLASVQNFADVYRYPHQLLLHH